MVKRILKIGIPVLVIGFLLAQLVPYRISNPKVIAEPNWDSKRTRDLAVAACFDCHSNQTRQRWYTHVAPISWLAVHDVNDGRDALNFSEWGKRRQHTNEIAEAIRGGSMPPGYYTWFGLHSSAKLTKAEKEELLNGLKRTFSQSP